MIDYSFCRMLMSLSTLFNFVFESKKMMFFGFPHWKGLAAFWDKFIKSYLFLLGWTDVDSLNPLFSQADKEFVWSLWKRLQVANPDLTQAVSLVVERWVDSSFKLLPERAQLLRIPLSHNRREICVKVVQGVFKAPWPFYWGYDEIWCRCWFKPSYPHSSSSTMETLLMITLFLRCSLSGHLEKPHAKYLSLSDKIVR